MSKLGQGGFCRKVIGDSITFVPKPAPTLGFWLDERLGQGGFCRKVIGGSITFVPKPALTLGFMSRYIIYQTQYTGEYIPGTVEAALDIACRRLRHHPVLTNPQDEIARDARETCQSYAPSWKAE